MQQKERQKKRGASAVAVQSRRAFASPISTEEVDGIYNALIGIDAVADTLIYNTGGCRQLSLENIEHLEDLFFGGKRIPGAIRHVPLSTDQTMLLITGALEKFLIIYVNDEPWPLIGFDHTDSEGSERSARFLHRIH